MSAWSRLAIARSGSRISAILASTSASALPLRYSASTSRVRSFIATRSSSLNFLVGFFVVGTSSPPCHAYQLAPHVPALGRVLEHGSHAARIVLVCAIVGRERCPFECLERREGS